MSRLDDRGKSVELTQINIRFDQLTSLLSETKTKFDSHTTHAQAVHELNLKKRELELAYNALEVDLAGISDYDEHIVKLDLKKKKEAIKRNLDDLLTDIEWKEQRMNQNQKTDSTPQLYNGTSKIEYGLNTSQDSTSTLQRTLAKVNETRQMARIVNNNLQLQNEQLAIVMDEAIDMEEALRQSKQSILVLARVIYTDGVMQVILSGVFLMVMAIIIYSAFIEPEM